MQRPIMTREAIVSFLFLDAHVRRAPTTERHSRVGGRACGLHVGFQFAELCMFVLSLTNAANGNVPGCDR